MAKYIMNHDDDDDGGVAEFYWIDIISSLGLYEHICCVCSITMTMNFNNISKTKWKRKI